MRRAVLVLCVMGLFSQGGCSVSNRPAGSGVVTTPTGKLVPAPVVSEPGVQEGVADEVQRLTEEELRQREEIERQQREIEDLRRQQRYDDDYRRY